jgi:two-component system OmpR family response regulator
LRDIRLRTNVPVIILGDERRADIDWVVGLELGAGDCATAPFGIRELLARVRAVLRRTARPCTARDPARGRCRFGGWQLDRRSRRLTNPDGAPVPLTKTEYALLKGPEHLQMAVMKSGLESSRRASFSHWKTSPVAGVN